jgi:hypothetical protein
VIKKFQLINIFLEILVLVVITLFVIFFYFPFMQRNSFPVTVLLLFAIVVCFILIRKGVLPKPSLKERKISLILLAINLTAVFVIGLLLGVSKAATHQNLILVTMVMTVVFTIGLLLAAFRARTSERLHI